MRARVKAIRKKKAVERLRAVRRVAPPVERVVRTTTRHRETGL